MSQRQWHTIIIYSCMAKILTGEFWPVSCSPFLPLPSHSKTTEKICRREKGVMIIDFLY